MNKVLILLAVSLFSTFSLFGQEIKGDASKGKDVFKTNCTACHALDKQLVGPALKGAPSRIQKEQNLGRDWLQKWIKDNKALRASGDKYANQLFEKYKSEMQQFPNLSEQDIDNVIAYIDNPPAEAPPVEEVAVGATSAKSTDSSMNYVLIGFAAIGTLLSFILFRLNKLVKLQTANSELLSEAQADKITSLCQFYTRYQKLSYVLIGAFGLFSLYGVWAGLFGIGVDKGYKPDQPIYFSHKIHAGENKIDCQLCHSGAKYGKVSEIPSASVCMNCHRNISEYKGKYIEPGKDRAFYTDQIKKLYEYIGWDETKQAYGKPKSETLKWTRIHNMPDFVYFNHSQHVVAGEKAIIGSHNKKNPTQQIDVVCKACHGQIDTMNVVQMANDFTMGWCIECHRTTEVDMGNAYNAAYFNKLHDKLKKQYSEDKSKITVDAIGGIECGKCHY